MWLIHVVTSCACINTIISTSLMVCEYFSSRINSGKSHLSGKVASFPQYKVESLHYSNPDVVHQMAGANSPPQHGMEEFYVLLGVSF